MTAHHSPNTDLLIEHFATLATAPAGIARLRELILQLAVQGKLGTQDAGDEPASDLIGKIQKEKSALIEKRKLRENKITELKEIQEMKYEIPPRWAWQRMGDVVFFQEGPGIRNWQFRTKGVKLLNVSNILNDGRLDFNSSDKYVSEEEVKEKYSQFLIEDKDLLLASSGGSWGKVAWFKDPGYPIILNTSTVRLRFYSEQFAERYLQYFMQTSFFRQQMVSQLVGIQPNFGSTHLGRCYIPLPPLSEQHRIVAKVDRLMLLCDEIEARQQHERTGCLKLGTASFAGLQNAESPEEFGRLWAQVCDAFDLILDCPENVAVLRQTILQLAVQGRLVRQEPGDEPAGKLVERIRKEKERLVKEGKIKKEKLLEKIEPVPYKVPDGWQLCQLGEISEIIMGNSPPGDTYNIYRDGVPLINGPTEFSKNPLGKTIVSQYTTHPTKFCKENDLLICVRGATTGRTNIAGFDACVGRGVAVIRSPSIQSYLNLFILTKAQQILSMGTGSTFPSISQNDLVTIPVPIPPLVEQHRIVEKVDVLMALCDQLEARLKERAGVQGRLAGAVVKQVAG